jgi:hypothetical protein
MFAFKFYESSSNPALFIAGLLVPLQKEKREKTMTSLAAIAFSLCLIFF